MALRSWISQPDAHQVLRDDRTDSLKIARYRMVRPLLASLAPTLHLTVY